MINNSKNSDFPEHSDKCTHDYKMDNNLIVKKEINLKSHNSHKEMDFFNKNNLNNEIKKTEQFLIHNDAINNDLIDFNKINNCENNENCVVDDKIVKVFTGVDCFNLKKDYNSVNNILSNNYINNQSYLTTVGDFNLNKNYNIRYFNIDKWYSSQIYVKLNLLKIILRKNSYCFKNLDFLEKPIELFIEQTKLNNLKNKMLFDKIYKNILEEFMQLNKQ